MRILVVSNLYPPNVIGGYERLCFEVTAGLAALGHEMVVLTSRYGGQVADYAGQRVVRELDLLTGPDIYTAFGGTDADRAAMNRANLAALDQTVRDVRPDAIFAWNLFFLDASLLDALERSGIRTAVMLTDNWLLVMRNAPFWTDFFQHSVLGDRALAVPPLPKPTARARIRRLLRRQEPGLEAVFGAAFVRDLYAAGGVTFARHRVIHNGVKQAAYTGLAAPDRTRLVSPDVLRLLFAGRLVDLKGAHTAVAALPLLDPAALGVDRIELTLLGDTQDAAYMARLRAEIAASGRAGQIKFAPTVPENALPALFAAHDIYVFPSLYEPFSLTLIHALALGIPTIASRAGGNPEIVRDGESGLLFRTGDAADLAAGLRRMAADGALRGRLARGGQDVARGFTFERMVGEMAAFLGDVNATGSRASAVPRPTGRAR